MYSHELIKKGRILKVITYKIYSNNRSIHHWHCGYLTGPRHFIKAIYDNLNNINEITYEVTKNNRTTVGFDTMHFGLSGTQVEAESYMEAWLLVVREHKRLL